LVLVFHMCCGFLPPELEPVRPKQGTADSVSPEIHPYSLFLLFFQFFPLLSQIYPFFLGLSLSVLPLDKSSHTRFELLRYVPDPYFHSRRSGRFFCELLPARGRDPHLHSSFFSEQSAGKRRKFFGKDVRFLQDILLSYISCTPLSQLSPEPFFPTSSLLLSLDWASTIFF